MSWLLKIRVLIYRMNQERIEYGKLIDDVLNNLALAWELSKESEPVVKESQRDSKN